MTAHNHHSRQDIKRSEAEHISGPNSANTAAVGSIRLGLPGRYVSLGRDLRPAAYDTVP